MSLQITPVLHLSALPRNSETAFQSYSFPDYGLFIMLFFLFHFSYHHILLFALKSDFHIQLHLISASTVHLTSFRTLHPTTFLLPFKFLARIYPIINSSPPPQKKIDFCFILSLCFFMVSICKEKYTYNYHTQ